MRSADDALYVAKETGRNRVVRFDSAEFIAHIQKSHPQPVPQPAPAVLADLHRESAAPPPPPDDDRQFAKGTGDGRQRAAGDATAGERGR